MFCEETAEGEKDVLTNEFLTDIWESVRRYEIRMPMEQYQNMVCVCVFFFIFMCL